MANIKQKVNIVLIDIKFSLTIIKILLVMHLVRHLLVVFCDF